MQKKEGYLIGLVAPPHDIGLRSGRCDASERLAATCDALARSKHTITWDQNTYSTCDCILFVDGNNDMAEAIRLAEVYKIPCSADISDFITDDQIRKSYERKMAMIGNAHNDDKFRTGAVRSGDADNERYDLISPIGLRRVAETYREGADKYGDYNWEQGMPISDILNHAIRHQYLYLSGDRSEDHLAHAAWGLFAAMHSEELWTHLNQRLRTEGCKPPAEESG